jgi:hypothetical protein
MAKNLFEVSLAIKTARINQVPCDWEMRSSECLQARWAAKAGK